MVDMPNRSDLPPATQRRIARDRHLSAYVGELERLSVTDDQTPLYNQRYLAMVLEPMFEAAVRGGYPLSAMMIDGDRLKPYVREHTNVAASRLVTAMGRLIYQKLRPDDTGFRYGGDEFFVLMPNTTLENAFDLAEGIRSGVERMFERDEAEYPVTVSIGIAKHPDTIIESGLSLLVEANRAMLRAKERGRNTVVPTSEEITALEQRVNL